MINNDYRNELKDKGIEYSNQALLSFFEKLDLNLNLCEEVNNIHIGVGETVSLDKKRASSEYHAADDQIILDESYLDEMVDFVIDAHEDKKERAERIAIHDIASSLIHEKLHALRRIRKPDNAIESKDYYTVIKKYLTQDINPEYIDPSDVLLVEHGITDKNDQAAIIRQQTLLEDSVIEALSQVIIYNSIPKNSNLTITELAAKVEKDDSYFIQAGAKIVELMGEDQIKRFVTTRFSQEPYSDMFYEMFAQDYYVLLSDIEEIDEVKNTGMAPSEIILNEFDEIINKQKNASHKRV